MKASVSVCVLEPMENMHIEKEKFHAVASTPKPAEFRHCQSLHIRRRAAGADGDR